MPNLESPTPSEAAAKAIELLGGPAEAARRLAVERGVKIGAWAVSKWRTSMTPADWVLWLARLTSWVVTPHELRPDLYPHPDDGMPKPLTLSGLESEGEAAARIAAAG
jgi:DNA-binding transcriptional regulator YdaS (Cro superfamily)